jgi:DNA polymerase III epsilon subunit-like protein
MPTKNEPLYVSIDVETAGPNPGTYSMLSIGACLVWHPDEHFYVEIQPVTDCATEEAMAISQLDMNKLKETGRTPEEAMSLFNDWLEKFTSTSSQLVFVAFNAPFDWMFVNDYFHRYFGSNPFGHKALDIKTYAMGVLGVPWENTGWLTLSNRYLANQSLTHNALQDAIDQARIFRELVAEQMLNHQREEHF